MSMLTDVDVSCQCPWSINHLEVEVADTDAVDAEQTRLAEAGFASIDERGTTCCYAQQDKFWVEDTFPGGLRRRGATARHHAVVLRIRLAQVLAYRGRYWGELS